MIDRTVDQAFIRDEAIVWYGPYLCPKCDFPIVAAGNEFGGLQLDAFHDHHYPNYKWQKHVCGVSIPMYVQEGWTPELQKASEENSNKPLI